MSDKKTLPMIGGLFAAALILGVIAGTSGSKPAPSSDVPPASESQPADSAEETAAQTEQPEETPAETGVKKAQIAEAGTGIVLTKADDYAEQYPLQYESYMKNNENDEVHEYTEVNPYLKTMYEGYGFAINYGSARGHTYVIEDLTSTGRPHKLANCFTCKTSSFTAAVLNDGVETYSMAFEDFESKVTDPFGCFHCHGDQTGNGEIVITHGYQVDAAGEDFEKIDAANLSCGQCHTEYYFDPVTKATTLGYQNLASMTPEKMLEYENSIVDGEGNMFADWVDEDTGVRKLKVQHPEFETYLGAGSPHGAEGSFYSLTCADCHMGKTTAEDGTVYTNHYWITPLENEELLNSTCSQCHKDLASEVKAIQDETTTRENELGEAFVQLDKDLAAAIKDKKIEGEDLEKARLAFRNAQWYWDFVYVENSEGVHNPKLTKECLDKAEELIKEVRSYLE
ncbi:MAG: ammonia-forming cytochrome c nitrite reductase subunit c552 [Solobacterium sp.]|nr:ammonia-forming cytochrome c nitrite reductase subunit c552 [Solobacterium sp.]